MKHVSPSFDKLWLATIYCFSVLRFLLGRPTHGTNVPSDFFKICVGIKFYRNSSQFGMTYMIYVRKHFWKEHLCALEVFLRALISHPTCMCARTRPQLRVNIAQCTGPHSTRFNRIWLNEHSRTRQGC